MDITIGLDKVRLKHSYTDSPHCDEEYQRLHGWIKSSRDGEFGKKGSLSTPHPDSALSRLHQILPDGGYLDVQYGYAGKKQSVWFQFNPSKLTGSDLAALKGHFSILLENGFTTLLERGWMSYLEIPIDVREASFEEYIFVDASLRSADIGFEKVGTTYIGSERSNRHFCVYDKSKEQEYKGEFAIQTLRIEAILQGSKGFPLAELDLQPSPFSTLLVVDRTAIGESNHPLVQELLGRLQALGGHFQAAYLSFPLKRRKELKKVLYELQPHWWQPGEIWRHFPESFSWMAELI